MCEWIVHNFPWYLVEVLENCLLRDDPLEYVGWQPGRWWCGATKDVPTPLHVSAIYFDGKFVAADQFYNNNTNVQVQETTSAVDDKNNPDWLDTRSPPVLIRHFINRAGAALAGNNYPGKLSNLANGSFCTGWWVQKSLFWQLDQLRLPLDNSQATCKCKQN